MRFLLLLTGCLGINAMAEREPRQRTINEVQVVGKAALELYGVLTTPGTISTPAPQEKTASYKAYEKVWLSSDKKALVACNYCVGVGLDGETYTAEGSASCRVKSVDPKFPEETIRPVPLIMLCEMPPLPR